MTKNFEQQLKELKKEFNDAKNEEIRLQTRLEEVKKRRKEAHDQIKEKGYDVKTLPKIIEEKEQELEETLDELRDHLPGNDNDEDDDWDE